MDRYIKLNKEYKELEEVNKYFIDYHNMLGNIKNAKEILAEETDAELREMAKMEISELEEKKPEMEEEIKVLLIPKDPEDDKNAIVELRGGNWW